MSDPYMGEIRVFGFNFAPVGWAYCDGSLLAIDQYTALYSLLGTTFGGDGNTTFGLPDLRGRIAVHQGQGPGLSNYVQGQVSGTETVALTGANLPTHSHTLMATTAAATHTSPAGHLPATIAAPDTLYAQSGGANASIPMNPSVASIGSGMGHPNMMPVLAMNPCICLESIYPQQN